MLLVTCPLAIDASFQPCSDPKERFQSDHILSHSPEKAQPLAYGAKCVVWITSAIELNSEWFSGHHGRARCIEGGATEKPEVHLKVEPIFKVNYAIQKCDQLLANLLTKFLHICYCNIF